MRQNGSRAMSAITCEARHGGLQSLALNAEAKCSLRSPPHHGGALHSSAVIAARFVAPRRWRATSRHVHERRKLEVECQRTADLVGQRPSTMMPTWSAVCDTSAKIWLDTIAVMPWPGSERMSPRSSSMPMGSSPLTGSSRMSRRGLSSNASAMPRRCTRRTLPGALLSGARQVRPFQAPWPMRASGMPAARAHAQVLARR